MQSKIIDNGKVYTKESLFTIYNTLKNMNKSQKDITNKINLITDKIKLMPKKIEYIPANIKEYRPNLRKKYASSPESWHAWPDKYYNTIYENRDLDPSSQKYKDNIKYIKSVDRLYNNYLKRIEKRVQKRKEEVKQINDSESAKIKYIYN